MSTPQTAQPPPSPPLRHGWNLGRTTGAVGGSILAIVGAVLVLAGVVLVALHFSERSDDGFITSGSERLQSDSYAIRTENIDLGNATDTAPNDLLGTLRVTIRTASSSPAFAGVARRADVESYLSGVEHSVLTDVDDPEYREVAGDSRPARPASQPFWAAQAEGSGDQVLEWDVEGGDWSVVFLNADAKPGVDVDASVGIKIWWLVWVGVAILIFGLMFIAGGVALIVIMRREARELL